MLNHHEPIWKGKTFSWTLVKESESGSVVSDSLRPNGLYSPWNSPGQNTGVGSLSLLQGIFPNQGRNPGLPHCRQILYQMSHKGSPRILEWAAYPFSRESSWPRNWTGVSCIAGSFFTSWATSEAKSRTLRVKYLFQSSHGSREDPSLSSSPVLVSWCQWSVSWPRGLGLGPRKHQCGQLRLEADGPDNWTICAQMSISKTKDISVLFGLSFQPDRKALTFLPHPLF